MSTSRSQLVDEAVTPWWHSLSRCVRLARLGGDDFVHRKDWIARPPFLALAVLEVWP